MRVNESKIPDEFICPISHEIMSDPYTTPSGRSFQKEGIVQWVQENKKDPFNRASITEKDIVPNVALRFAIVDYKQMSEGKGSLLEIYHQRGSNKIEELKKYLNESKICIAAEEKGQEVKFAVERSVTVWPFPVICPKTGVLITDPIIEADGETYQKPNESKQQHITNYNLKNTLNLFPITLDNKLNFQINKIKRLIKQTAQANAKIISFQVARAQARQAELEREEQELRRALAEVERMNRQQRRKKYLWGAAAVIATSYTCMAVYDYFYGEEVNKQNEIIPTAGHWFGSALLKPVVTSVTAAQTLLSKIGKVFEVKEEDKQHQQYLKDCRNSQPSQCDKAVKHALSLGRVDLLKKLHQAIHIKYFIKSMENAISKYNFTDMSMLLQLDPKILEMIDHALFSVTDDQEGIQLLDYLLERGYSIDKTPHHDTRLMRALRYDEVALAKALINRGASLASRPSGQSPLHIAIAKQQMDLIREIIARDQPLAKKIVNDNPKLQEEILQVGNFEMISELIAKDVFNVNGSKQFNPLFAAYSGSTRVFRFLVSQGASIEKFIEKLEQVLDQPFGFNHMHLFKLFESGLILNECNIAQKVLLKAFESKNSNPIDLIELLLAKGIRLPDSFDFKNAITQQVLYSFNFDSEYASRELMVLLKAAAFREDFEAIVKEITPHSVAYANTNALAMVINAGYQLDIKSWESVQQDRILKALEKLNKLEPLVVKIDIKPRIKGLQGVLKYAAHMGYKDVIKAVLKTNLMDYETVKQAAMIAHKLNHSKVYPAIFNLLRNHMRTLSAPLTPPHYAFYQPTPQLPMVSKESGRRMGRGR